MFGKSSLGREQTLRQEIAAAELQFQEAFESLIEATRFVAQLAGCDGAIALTDDLVLLGFGVEIRAELRQGVEVLEVLDEMQKNYLLLDVEAFGMRHRSAIKLISHHADCRALVVSQDGPITAVWSEGDRVFVKRGLELTNLNMPWA
jgi:hypothetical protein